MKKLGAQVLIFIQFLCITQAVLGQKVLKVFLMGGQSNMVGNGDNNVLPTELQQHRSDIPIYVFGTANYNWGPLMPGLGSVPAAHGAELAFGYDIKEAFPTANIAIIKGAWSGTSLFAAWRPPSSGGTTGNLFTTFINNVKAGLAQKMQEGYTVQLAGMCWMQGESDGMNATECQNYQTNLKNFINDVRSKLNAPDMPFVIGKVMLNATYPYDNIIRSAEDQVAASLPNVGIFDTDGLTVANAHFSIDGCIGLGHRFANAIIPRVTLNTTRTPFKGTMSIPGIVEAEDFDSGGQNLTYYDTDPANNGAQYRTTESVDIEICTEGGYNVGWIASGEWMEYTVNVATTGNYQVSCRVAGPNDNTQFHIAFDGVDKTGIIIVNKTAGFQNWTSINKNLSLTAGLHSMRFFVDQTNGFNINSFTFTTAGAPDVVTTNNFQADFERVIRVYPNPATGEKFYVQLPDYTPEVDWQILNLLGDIISSGILNPGSRSGIPSPAADGLYILNLKGKDFTHFTKLIIAH
jgi:hypothetical protein